ncbi:LOW QUALITY PROTEIN: hypothetical protein NC652_027024 [Populus alba x Populus x berolinensis]|nr:LOW QUALITY PROTEIN: hypothetical protein NC652_027024 [Populus alba x Populus x berolinensis]
MATSTQGVNLDPEKQTLLNQHQEKHFTAGEIVRDIIIGVSDGLTVPFALAAGLSGANATSSIVLTAGIAEVAAGAISMGLGGYLAAKSEADHYARELRREQEEIKSVPDTEHDYKLSCCKKSKADGWGYSFGEKMQRRLRWLRYCNTNGIEPHEYGPVVSALRKKPQAWLDFMLKFELGLEKPDPRRALQSAQTKCHCLHSDLNPSFLYMFIPSAQDAVIASLLLIFGFAKGYFTGNKPFRSAFQTALIGAIASAAAFGMAKAVHP